MELVKELIAWVVPQLPPFLLGFVAGYLLHLIRSRAESQKALTKEAYIPLHQQLHDARSLLERRQQFYSTSEWERLKATGIAGGLTYSTRGKLRHLYEQTLEEYVKAWLAARRATDDLQRRWDNQFGSPPPSGARVLDFDWWSFLADEEFRPRQMALGGNEAIPLFERTISHAGLRDLGVTLDQFLRQRWDETQGNKVFSRYRLSRKEASREIGAVQEHLSRKIRV